MNNVTKLKDNITTDELEFYKIEVFVYSDMLTEVLRAITERKVTPTYWQVARP